MKVYLDTDFIAHAKYVEGYIEVEDSFFDYICPDNFSCFRFIPEGRSWTRQDGQIFYGKAISLVNPVKDMAIKQKRYEEQLLSEAFTSLQILIGE